LTSPIVFFFLLTKKFKELNTVKFIETFGSLNEGMRTSRVERTFASLAEMFKTLGTVAVLVKLREYPTIQIMSLIVLSTVKQGYLLAFLPYKDPKQKFLSVFNEGLVTLYLFTLLALTDANPNAQLRETAALIFIAIVFTYLLANFSCFLFVISVNLKLAWKNRRLLRSNKSNPISEPPTNQLTNPQPPLIPPAKKLLVYPPAHDSFHEVMSMSATSQTLVVGKHHKHNSEVSQMSRIKSGNNKRYVPQTKYEEFFSINQESS
jgi:hypothetical protein